MQYHVLIVNFEERALLGSFGSAAEAFCGLEGAAACTRMFDLAVIRDDGRVLVYMRPDIQGASSALTKSAMADSK